MKTKKILTSFLITSIIFIILGANHKESAASSPSSLGCMTVNPGTLTYGLRTTPDEQFLSVTSSGTWGAYVSGGWIKINGGGTLSSGGNATISVTLSNPPAGQPYYPCGTITSGTITFYGGCGDYITINVNYINCICC